MRNMLVGIIIAVMLSGCSIFGTDPIDVSTTPIEVVPLTLPGVDIYQAREIQWLIITPENYEETIQAISSKGGVALFALTSQDYENSSLNQSDIIKMIKQFQAIINAYENYYGNSLSAPALGQDEFPEIE